MATKVRVPPVTANLAAVVGHLGSLLGDACRRVLGGRESTGMWRIVRRCSRHLARRRSRPEALALSRSAARAGRSNVEGPTHAGEVAPRPCPVDEAALDYARRLAADWRATGLRVVLVQRRSAAGGGRESYELVAESPTTVLTCTCHGWRHGGALAGPTAWTVAVSTRRSAGDPDGAREAARDVGVAAGASHKAAWRQVLAWIDGAGRLHADAAEALAAVARPEPRSASPASRSRAPLAAVAAVLLAVGLWCGHLVLHRSAPAIAAQPEAEPARADAAPADGPI